MDVKIEEMVEKKCSRGIYLSSQLLQTPEAGEVQVETEEKKKEIMTRGVLFDVFCRQQLEKPSWSRSRRTEKGSGQHAGDRRITTQRGTETLQGM